ncbi:hypothetical protein GYMLUDRAFT_34726 [Collybiopsis luxurians FD-317 M1]|nr:hypothetical protein GYMLUDRAFT_34726 [Collybiopsis luxurians FD-317 M1]
MQPVFFSTYFRAVALPLLLFLSVSAAPFTKPRSLPRGVRHIALDEDTNEFVAFRRDGTFYGRYPADMESLSFVHKRDTASSCTNLTAAEAQQLPGWSKINNYANDNWGKGSRNIVTNPDQYPDSPALVCITNETVDVSFSGSPICQSNNVTVNGEVEGTNGSMKVEVAQGTSTSSSFTISTSSTIGVSSTLSVEIGIPDLGGVSDATTISTEVTNSQTKSFEATYNDTTSITHTYQTPQGKTCNAMISVNTCHSQATGKIRYLASGWVWFNYDSTTKGHYKWAASIDDILTNEDDRSSFADFQGSVAAETRANYQTICK